MGMTVGMSLPSMAEGFNRKEFLAWCKGIDDGPYSAISAGDRITFFNPELMTTLAACAAVTERVAIFANLVVSPIHRTAQLAKQLATIDVMSEGRLIVGFGVGGRPHDYEAVGAPFKRRHDRVDEIAAELKEIWAGKPPFEGADPVGPPMFQENGPLLVAGVMGQLGMGRAAKWADGVTGFSLSATYDEMAGQATMARDAWLGANRSSAPWLGSGSFCVLGVDNARPTLQNFGATYLSFFGDEVAKAIAATLTLDSADALTNLLDEAARVGLDEFTLVPGTWDLDCLEAMTETVSAWQEAQG